LKDIWLASKREHFEEEAIRQLEIEEKVHAAKKEALEKEGRKREAALLKECMQTGERPLRKERELRKKRQHRKGKNKCGTREFLEKS
jgi:hypothetical protein